MHEVRPRTLHEGDEPMVKAIWRRGARSAVLAMLVVVVLVAAGSAAAEPQQGGRASIGLEHVGGWWAALWAGFSGSPWAASEVAADQEAGDGPLLGSEPDEQPLSGDELPGGEGEVRPHLDPNG